MRVSVVRVSQEEGHVAIRLHGEGREHITVRTSDRDTIHLLGAYGKTFNVTFEEVEDADS